MYNPSKFFTVLAIMKKSGSGLLRMGGRREATDHSKHYSWTSRKVELDN